MIQLHTLHMLTKVEDSTVGSFNSSLGNCDTNLL